MGTHAPKASCGPLLSSTRSHYGRLSVAAQELPPARWTARTRTTAEIGEAGGFRDRLEQEREDDHELGTRGEEVVLRVERERLRARRQSPELAVWVSQMNPLADHDIKSVDIDGNDLWIEVKSTRGRHGRFHWPRAEFDLALRVRSRYVLVRVYEAAMPAPPFRYFHDPVGLVLSGSRNLDLDALAAEVAPL